MLNLMPTNISGFKVLAMYTDVEDCCDVWDCYVFHTACDKLSYTSVTIAVSSLHCNISI